MSKINVLIAGSTGYIGVQLTKILVNHKKVNIKYLCGSSSIGKKISYFDKSLSKYKLPKIIKFNKNLLLNVDVIFAALPNGETQKISKLLLKKNTLIDLSADFRLKKTSDFLKWYKIKHSASNMIKDSIYALPEIKRNRIKNKKIISCPGCYPTSILLPLIPLLKKRLISNNNIIIDSKSGYSGAGRGVHKKYIRKNLYESLSAYGIANHRHNSEIQQELDLCSGKKNNFHFTPHLTPMFRGILSTIYIDLIKGVTKNKINSVLNKYYKKEIFVSIAKPDTLLSTNDVINTNNCIISVCKSKHRRKLIILSVIDNLIKGGSGQAIQNMNILYNFKENEGLNA
ncbi:MAG TPA: N-acetyl-gamma-glutamyl-phosphate reductase [Candidatus Pelagibacter bacterium]|jgi:N-acetyl-gamma-glutamyl-phosphate reductase|nr:N-acetyl-gamma-glutamyl-phosphate reductase [Candidatus Pelagibacter bacterium]